MKIIHSLNSEWIKTKNSAVMWLIAGGALFVPLFITIGRLLKYNETLLINSSEGVWLKLFNQNWQFMAVFLLPMGIILVSSLLAQIEFRNNTWKQLFTTPQSMSTIFLAKYIIVFVVFILFFLLFNIGIYLSAVVPASIFNDIPYPSDNFPFKEYFIGNAYYFLYCLPIVAFQYLMSLHIKNFIVPVGLGLVLVVISLIAANNQYGYLVPYIYGGMKFLIADNRIDETINISYWAFGYFLYFSFANYLIFICRMQTETSNFFKLKPLLITLCLTLVIGVLFIVFFHSSSIERSNTDHSQEEIEKKIKFIENNLGAFYLENDSDWTLNKRMEFYKVKGLSIAVIHNYKIEWAKSYGFADEAKKTPVTTNTLFEPGSLSKSLNAFALMQMVQNKQVDLFTDINHYLRTWMFPYDSISNGKKITLLNLLTHTAGLGVHGFEGYRKGDSLPNIQQILNGTKPANSVAVRSIFEPNKKMEYSGGGTLISQLLLMDVSQKAYDVYLNEQILRPLQMMNSFYTQPIPEIKKPFAATGYDSLGIALPYKYPIMLEQAASGLWTTPTDICKFIIEIQKSLIGKSNKILTQKNTSLMLTPYLDERTSIGFFVDEFKGYKYFSHEAGNWGFSGAFYASMHGGSGAVIFINSENEEIIREIGNSIISVYHWNGFDKKENLKLAPVKESTLERYIGKYEAKTENQSVEILKEKDTYYYLINKQKFKMYFISSSKFINMESPSVKSFELDKDGFPVGFNIKYKDKELYFKRNSTR